jgi:hypothetical protein
MDPNSIGIGIAHDMRRPRSAPADPLMDDLEAIITRLIERKRDLDKAPPSVALSRAS